MPFAKGNANRIMYPKGTNVNVRAYPYTVDTVKLSTGETVKNILTNIKKGNPVGRTSGTYVQMDDGRWWQVNLYTSINGRSYAYCREDVIMLSPPGESSQGDKYGSQLLTDLINSDIKLYQNLLITSELLDKAKEKGINISQYEDKATTLVKRYNERQQSIKDSNLVKTSNWINSKWKWLQNKWASLVNGIGIAVGITVALTATATLVTTAIIFYAFRPKYEDSKADLKVSENLKKAVANLTPQEASDLITDLESQIDTAYTQGRQDQKFSSLFGNVKTLGIIVGTYLLVDKLILRKNAG